MSDYDRIAQAIEYIHNRVDDQPSLAEVASAVKLSEFHFQRLFSRWAGVTPKRYLQLLTLEHAKVLLRDQQLSTLDASYSLGLSSSSRLYDHFVTLDAVTPTEYRQQGKGICFHYGYHSTPFGWVFVAMTDRGISRLEFVESYNAVEPLTELQLQWCFADFVEDKAATELVVQTLFTEQLTEQSKPISLWVRGTNFQINVWRALLQLKPGEVASYGDIARLIGNPKASRAVGTAIGNNPVGLIIPCHRVLRQNGALGGYRWGEVRKHAILMREATTADAG